MGAIAPSLKPTIVTDAHITPGTSLGYELNASQRMPPWDELQYNQFGMSNGGALTGEFLNQADDGRLAGDDGCWEGILHSAMAGALERLKNGFYSFLFDNASACSNGGIVDVGFFTPILARSATDGTVLDSLSDAGRVDHSAMQRSFAQTLDSQRLQSILGCGSRMTHDFLIQTADQAQLCDDMLWNGRELSSDPIESFVSQNAIASDPVEQFTDLHEGGTIHSTLTVFPERLENGFDSFLFDSASACSTDEIADDGFITPCLARSAACDTVLDSMSDAGRVDHSTTQRGFAQTLDLQKPQFIWKWHPFLNAVFGKGYIVYDLFPHVSLKRPASLLVDLTGDEMEEAPIQKALRRGQFKALFSKAIKHSAVVHEETQRANFMADWTSIVLLNLFAFAAFDKARSESLESELRAVVYTTSAECLSWKAASTVGKRLGAMKRFAEFCTARTLSPFQLDDSLRSLELQIISQSGPLATANGEKVSMRTSLQQQI